MICRRYLFRNRYSVEYLYTLKEMFEDEFGNENLIGFIPSMDQYADLWNNFDMNYWTNDTGDGYQLWTYIWNTYKDHIALITDEEWNRENNQEVIDFWHEFYGIWNRTHKYYEKMISLLKDNESKLLAQVSSLTESDNRFNNTPDQSGDYSGLDYATTINKNKITTSSDAGTILERLEEVRRRYTDYYEKWSREFNKLFISPLNYENSTTLEEFY